MQQCLDFNTKEIFSISEVYDKNIDFEKIFVLFRDKDENLALHSARTAVLSEILGYELTKDKEFCRKLFLSGLLHDAGKLETPDKILKSSTSISDEDWRTISAHPEDGLIFLKKIKIDDKIIASSVLTHHLRFDGTGYPKIKAQQCLASLIVSVCDAYDAMRFGRPYAKPRNIDEALTEIKKNSGTQFCPEVVSVFLGLTGILESLDY